MSSSAAPHFYALKLLRTILRDLLDLGEIEAVVREEPAIAYKLLRYLNSPSSATQSPRAFPFRRLPRLRLSG